jgi:exonuclease VII large subunit
MVTRGGGSFDDLVGFSDWNLLEIIHNCPFITLSAVGHQIDNQLSDMVADYTFATPSSGAKFIVETQKHFLSFIEKIKKQINSVNEKFLISKNKFTHVIHNYTNILLDYDIKEITNFMTKYKLFVNNISNSWSKTKTNFYNQLSNIKPCIYRNDNEISSINDFFDVNKNPKNPKKIEIYFADGSINLYYKIINYEFR